MCSEAIGDFSGQRLRLGAVAREVDGNGIAQIAIALVGEHEAYRVMLAVVLVIGVFAIEQIAHGAHISFKALQDHGLSAQEAHAGVAGAQRNENPPRCNHVERGHRARQRGCQTQARHGHAHAELHGLGLLRGHGEKHKSIRTDKRAVGHPQVCEAQLLGFGDVLHFVELGPG